MSGMAFEDDRQWLRDELLIEADRYTMDLFATAEMRQAQEVRRALKHLNELRHEVSLTQKENRKINEAIAALTAALARMG